MACPYSTIVFDVDGTLYSDKKMAWASRDFFFRHPRIMLANWKARRTVRKLEYEELEKTICSLLATYLNVSYETASHYKNTLLFHGWEKSAFSHGRVRPFKDLLPFISFLKEQGIKVGLFSDYPVTGEKFTYLGLKDLWDFKMCSEESNYLKPDVKSFQFLIDKYNLVPEKTLYVGNHYHYDMGGCTSVGMDGALLTRSKNQGRRPLAKYLFRNFQQLREKLFQ